MKNLILITSLFSVFLVSQNMFSSKEVPIFPNLKNYDTFGELYHHSCNGSSATGATCSATCTDSESCACASYFWSCVCTCGKTKPISQSITPPSVETMEKLEKVIAEDKTEIAAIIIKRLPLLYDAGIKGEVEKYIKIAKILDKEMMELKPETLNKLIQVVKPS